MWNVNLGESKANCILATFSTWLASSVAAVNGGASLKLKNHSRPELHLDIDHVHAHGCGTSLTHYTCEHARTERKYNGALVVCR